VASFFNLSFFLCFRLWSILVEEFESLSGLIAIKDVLELGEGWWNFQTQLEDLALTLKTNIPWPLHHTRQIALRLEILTDTEVARTFVNEGVLGRLLSASFSLREGSRSRFLCFWCL